MLPCAYAREAVDRPKFGSGTAAVGVGRAGLYFPGWFPAWAPYAAFGALVAGWAWRRWRLGIWYAYADGLAHLLSVWRDAARGCLGSPWPAARAIFDPQAYILLWNFCLFWTVVTHASRSGSRRSGHWAVCAQRAGDCAGRAAGHELAVQVPRAEQALSAIPSPLLGVFQGAESGFHPNQVAGTLLYAFPLLFAITAADAIHRRRTLASRLVTWLVWVSTPVAGLALLLTQCGRRCWG